MHVGHLLAAAEARRVADERGGRCLLRIEDIDPRAQDPRWTKLLYEDLAWLNLHFDGEVMVQSRRFDRYAAVLESLRARGFLYPCFCTRGEIKQQLAELGRAPHATLGYLYPGTCKTMSAEERAERLARGDSHAWRLDMQRVQETYGCLEWVDELRGVQRCVPAEYGDVVLARKEFPASYHLCVVVDDAEQGVTHVTRGEDLFDATHIHRALQAVLGVPTPVYRHHGLLRDNSGKRLAKRDGARALASLRAEGYTPQQVRDSLAAALQNGGIWQVAPPPADGK